MAMKKLLLAALLLTGCGPAIGINQQRLNAAYERERVGAPPVNILEALAQNERCTSLYTWKNVLTGLGGALTVSGGGVTAGTVVATSNSNATAKEALGVTAGSLSGLGGVLVIGGAILQQQFTENHCVAVPAP